MPEISRSELETALQDVDFPADRDELLGSAVARSEDMKRALRSLPPEVEFANVQEVVRSVNVDVEHGDGHVSRAERGVAPREGR